MKRNTVAGAIALFLGLPLAVGAWALAASGCGLIIGLGDREPFPDGGKSGDGSSGSSSGSTSCPTGTLPCSYTGTCCYVAVQTCTMTGCATVCLGDAGCLPCHIPGDSCQYPSDCCAGGCSSGTCY